MGTCGPEIVQSLPAVESTPTRKRERRSIELKRQIVEETLVVGASVARVARAHGVNANQVFQWRRLYEQGRLGNSGASRAVLLPVSIAPALSQTTALVATSGKAGTRGK